MRFRLLLLPALWCTSVALAQDPYIYLTVHNLGCRQSNHTYSGFMPDYGFGEGDLVQLILAGPNGIIDPPAQDGSPGGDDQLAQNPGVPFAMNPESFTHWPNTFYSPEAILVQRAGVGPQPALAPGSKFYVRAWNGPSPGHSNRYYNSDRLWQDYPIGQESCNVDSAVRTIRNQLYVPALVTYAVLFDNGHTFIPPLAVTVLNPNGGETWMEGDTVTLQWSAPPEITEVDVLLQRNTGGPWERLVALSSNDGTETWVVGAPSGSQCLIRVQDCADTLEYDVSDQPFTILQLGAPAAPQVVVNGDSTGVILLWRRVPGAIQYRVEASLNFEPWTPVVSTSDTTVLLPLTDLQVEYQLFRVFSIR